MSFEEVLRHKQRIDTLSRSLLGEPAFEDIHVQLPDPAWPESGFIRASSWLYCLYFEGGHTSVKFLRRLGEAYQLLDRGLVDQHIEAVRCLRTELHHNLGFEDSDQQTRTSAEIWKRNACGTALPSNSEQWGECYRVLVDEACTILVAIENLVRQIEAEGSAASEHLEDWRRRLSRSWPAAFFDPLVEDAARRLGRSALKTVAFRNRHLDRWRRQLELLDDGFDFEHEATLCIEKTLLDDQSSVLPVTGRDIIDELEVEPGPIVGRLLEEARRFYQSQPCEREAVLGHLRDFHSNSHADEVLRKN